MVYITGPVDPFSETNKIVLKTTDNIKDVCSYPPSLFDTSFRHVNELPAAY